MIQLQLKEKFLRGPHSSTPFRSEALFFPQMLPSHPEYLRPNTTKASTTGGTEREMNLSSTGVYSSSPKICCTFDVAN